MHWRRPAPQRGLAINLYLLYVSVLTLAYGLVFFTHIARKWLLAEWLINYQGGFVRRGLPGEAAYLLGRICHVSPVAFVVLFNLVLYAIVFAAVRQLALDSTRRLWVLLLVFSPAALSFQLLDLIAGFHKELIYLAALSLFVVVLRRYRVSAAGAAAYISAALLLMTFSHEPLICFAPYFFAALMLGGRSFSQAARECAIPFALGVLAAVYCARHLGDMQAAARICYSLGYTFHPDGAANQICSGGAIAYLGHTSAMAAQDMRGWLRKDHMLALYPPLALLALAPAAAGSFVLARAGCQRGLRVVWYSAAAAFVGSLVLFVYGSDWGRWIYIHIVSITVLLLFLDGRARPAASSATVAPVSRGRRLAATCLLIAYSTLWTLPHFNENAPHFGYIDLARSFAQLPKKYAQSKQVQPVAVRPGRTAIDPTAR